jgi:dihydrofolate synthase/folylpolyglutamate synthase
MNYREANEYMEQLKSHGIVPGLEAITELCNRLGNPQDTLRFVHIAGTNGKGSTLTFLASICRAAGHRTGSFSSPPLEKLSEMIMIDGRKITQVAFARYLTQIKKAVDAIVADSLPQPTEFEVLTALAFLYFHEEKVDIVILEAGMGGRFDATNIIKNTLLSIICPISIDHSEWLGNSLEEIAAHKAGIIKKDSIVLCARQTNSVWEIIRDEALNNECFFWSSPLASYCIKKPSIPDYQKLCISQRLEHSRMKNLTIYAVGHHQVENAILAIEAAHLLGRVRYIIRPNHIARGLKTAKFHGRFEMIAAKPPFFVDGAHNEEAARRLAETIKIYYPKRKLTFIIGVLADKDYRRILAATSSLATHIITVTPPIPRGLSSYDLAVAALGIHDNVTAADSIHEACEMALALAGKNGGIIAFGSLSIIADIKKSVKKITTNKHQVILSS